MTSKVTQKHAQNMARFLASKSYSTKPYLGPNDRKTAQKMGSFYTQT
jgi:hypothetical protein